MSQLPMTVYSVTVCLLLTVSVISGLLQFHPLRFASKSPSNVFERLNSITNSHICVWSHQDEVEESVSDLLASLVSSRNKSVNSLILEEDVLFREDCHHNVVWLQNVTSCSKVWTTHRPITALHFVYVMLDTAWESGVEDLPSCLADFGFARVVLVFLRNGRVFSLSPPQFPPRHFTEAKLDDLLAPVKLVFNSLNGREVNVAVFNCTPYVVFSQGFDPEFMDGVEGRVLKELSKSLNFKINVLEQSKERYGTRVGSSWGDGGVIGALKHYQADLGMCNIWNDLLNIPVLDFAPHNNLVSYTFLVPRPRIVHGTWINLTVIFHVNVWMAALFSYFAYCFCYWLTCKLVSPNNSVDPIESMLTVFGILTLTSWHFKSAARQLVFWWAVFVLLLTAAYSSGIAARLTRPRYEPRLDTVKQLVDTGFHWYADNVSQQLKDFLFNVADNTEKTWVNRYKFLAAPKTLTAVRSRKYAFLVQRLGSSVLIFNVHGLDYHHDLKDMRVLKEKTIDNIYTCFGLPKQSALSYTLQNALLQLRQMGLVDHWYQVAVQQHTSNYMKELQKEKDSNVRVELKPLTMNNLSAPFSILLVGLCLSAVLFLLEILYERYQNRNVNNKVYPLSQFID